MISRINPISHLPLVISTVIKGIGTVTLASLCIIWIAGNDLTVVGVADDAVAVPAVASFGYGMKLIFGM